MTEPFADAPGRIDLASAFRARWAGREHEDAILAQSGSTPFDAFLERVERMAGLIEAHGAALGATVGVAVQDPLLHLVAGMAALIGGWPQVCLPSHETPDSNRSTAERLGVALVVCETPQPWMAAASTLIVSDAALRAAPRGAAWRDAAGGDTTFFVKTSGSTSLPKLFGLSHARLDEAIRNVAQDERERRVMRSSSIEFDSTRMYRLFALVAGRATVMPPRDMADLGAHCARFDVSQVHIGAYPLASLMAGGRAVSRMPDASSVLSGGSRVPGALRADIAARLSANLFVSYATSEVGPISIAEPGEHDAFPEGVGAPREGVEVEVVDADGVEVAPGETGEVRVRRAHSPTAYLGREAAAQFRDGWFYPRDLVSRPDGGPLIYHGRSDDVMMLNGIKIAASAIEDALSALPGVREAVAFPLTSRVHGEVPAAAVVLAPGAEATEAALLAQCRRALGIRGPRRIVIVDAIPRTHTGKPMKRELAGM